MVVVMAANRELVAALKALTEKVEALESGRSSRPLANKGTSLSGQVPGSVTPGTVKGTLTLWVPRADGNGTRPVSHKPETWEFIISHVAALKAALR